MILDFTPEINELIAQQGWNEETMLAMLAGFLSDKVPGWQTEFAAHLQVIAAEENGEASEDEEDEGDEGDEEE